MKKEKVNKLLLIVLVLCIIGCGIYLFSTYNDYFRNKNKKEVDHIENYDYILYDKSTSLYKKLYYKLKDILNSKNINEEEYLQTISQMFCIDFYTLNNKSNSNDIGGIQFVYSKVKNNFKDKAKDSLYAYIETKKSRDLPEVKKVIVESVNNVKYTYLSKLDNDAYEVKTLIEYKKDLGYESEITLYFVHEDNKLSLVEVA